MSALAEFLKSEADKLRAEHPKRAELVAEWTAAVTHFLDQCERWAKEADQEGVLTVRRRTYRVREEQLGRYEIPGLDLDLDGRLVEVAPAARMVVTRLTAPGESEGRRADGRIDFSRDGEPLYYAYRLRSEAGDRWFLIQPTVKRADGRTEGAGVPLDRTAFESALLGLFR